MSREELQRFFERLRDYLEIQAKGSVQRFLNLATKAQAEDQLRALVQEGIKHATDAQ